ncbi:MAG: tryptophan synthase subunit alpha [Firmicutes bacterium]|nr:tryptophan synthase subunit alpha [Bacillota bacterium]
MNRLSIAFTRRCGKDHRTCRTDCTFSTKKALIPFITGGYPNLETSEQLILAAADAGANMIIIGVPFSDPVAESPPVQKAEETALAGGCNVDKIFEITERTSYKVQIPMLFNVYANSIFVYGTDKFLEKCIKSSIEGLIVPDLPFEEKAEFAATCKKRAVQLISTIVPTDETRLSQIAENADGFFNCTVGIQDISSLMAQVKQIKNIPCAMGLDLDLDEVTAEQIKQVAADGIIISGKIVELLDNGGVSSVEEYLQALRTALDSVA